MNSAATLSASHYADERQNVKTHGIFQNAKLQYIQVTTNIIYCQKRRSSSDWSEYAGQA